MSSVPKSEVSMYGPLALLVFSRVVGRGAKDMSPARLMAQWAQEPSLTQVGVWGLKASHLAYSLPMENMERAHGGLFA